MDNILNLTNKIEYIRSPRDGCLNVRENEKMLLNTNYIVALHGCSIEVRNGDSWVLKKEHVEEVFNILLEV